MKGALTQHQPWIRNAAYDSTFILLPPFLSLLVVSLLPARFISTSDMPVAGWVLLVLFVDVAHVYSTLFNTYFNRARFRRHRALFLGVPFACLMAGILLHLAGGLIFWRVLAYLAVFHFVRQQYGFMRIYSRSQADNQPGTILNGLMIYAATIYPLVYWHCTPGRNFNWFVENDFLIARADAIKTIAAALYMIIIFSYLAKELFLFFRLRRFNAPRNILVAGTALSWFFGIVYFNGDMAFTLLNVVSHGVPYMALVWSGIVRPAKEPFVSARLRTRFFPGRTALGLVIFLGTLFLLAYLEEGLWDGLVWREHMGVFGLFKNLPQVSDKWLLAVLVPLLSLPQSVHYVLDGFIWRKRFV